MTKVMTFAREFPTWHPRKGKPTDFVDSICNSFVILDIPINAEEICYNRILNQHELVETIKRHTIRSGDRWKVGDKFSPRVWSGKPYNSKMITIAPDIEVKKVWDVQISWHGYYLNIYINWNTHSGKRYMSTSEIAENDGLKTIDFENWFSCNPTFKQNGFVFRGQIICWADIVEY